MKKFIIILIGFFTFSSCGADQATVDKMTSEMCEALDGVDTSDLSSLMDAAIAMMDVTAKEDEYSSVSQAQMESAMKDKCPDSWKVFEEILAMGE